MIDFPLTKPAKTNILYYSVCNNSVIITVGSENSNVRRSLILNLGIFRGCAAKAAAVFFIFTGLIITHPQDSMAAARTEVQTRSSYMVTIEAPSVDVYTYKSKSSGKLGQVRRGMQPWWRRTAEPWTAVQGNGVRWWSLLFSFWGEPMSMAALTRTQGWTALVLPAIL